MAQSTVANFIEAVKTDPSLIAELKIAVDRGFSNTIRARFNYF